MARNYIVRWHCCDCGGEHHIEVRGLHKAALAAERVIKAGRAEVTIQDAADCEMQIASIADNLVHYMALGGVTFDLWQP